MRTLCSSNSGDLANVLSGRVRYTGMPRGVGTTGLGRARLVKPQAQNHCRLNQCVAQNHCRRDQCVAQNHCRRDQCVAQNHCRRNQCVVRSGSARCLDSPPSTAQLYVVISNKLWLISLCMTIQSADLGHGVTGSRGHGVKGGHAITQA
jgi:hypothetical protein